MITIRSAVASDVDSLWRILEPTIRAGETYPLPRDLDREGALAYWFAPGNVVFVAEEDHQMVGSYFLRANQRGGGAHVANCGYMSAPWAYGRGVARTMCAHSLDQARQLRFRAMQFNFVISTNQRAFHLWQQCGFNIVGRLPGAFEHPDQGFVDVFVMHRLL